MDSNDLITLQFSSVVVYTSTYGLILSQRKERPMKDMFQCPGGQFIDNNETPVQCGQRELFEETNLSLNEERLKFVKTFQYGPSPYGHHENCLRIVHVFYTKLTHEEKGLIKDREPTKATPWQDRDIDQVNPDNCITSLKDFLNEGYGYFRMYRTTERYGKEAVFRLESSNSFVLRIYGPPRMDSSEDVRSLYMKEKFRNFRRVKQFTGDYDDWRLTEEQRKQCDVERPITNYEVIKYLMSLSDSTIVTYISRENLEEILRLLTQNDLLFFKWITQIIEERYRYWHSERLHDLGDSISEALNDVMDKNEREIQLLEFRKPPLNSRREKLIKRLVNEELESENREENSYDIEIDEDQEGYYSDDMNED